MTGNLLSQSVFLPICAVENVLHNLRKIDYYTLWQTWKLGGRLPKNVFSLTRLAKKIRKQILKMLNNDSLYQYLAGIEVQHYYPNWWTGV